MAGKVADEILVNIQVQKGQADREVRNWQNQFNRSMSSIDSKVKGTERQIGASSREIGGHLRTLAGALAAGVSVRAVTGLLDKYTQLQNRLKVVGLEGRGLVAVQEDLFDIANRNGTAVNGLGELYSRMSLAQKDLGASTEEMLAVTSGVSAALRVQGLSAEQASGPLLQLGQAMGAGVVRAEEFNSLIEGIPTLVQAAANHIDGAGGSISRLRSMLAEGKVTSQAFFQALLKGLPELEAQATRSSLTIGQAMTTLQNEMIRYAGQVDASLGVSEKFVAMIGLLSNNLDKIAPAIGVIASVLGGRFLAGMIGSTLATVRQEVAFQRMGGAAGVAVPPVTLLTASTARFATAAEIAAAQAAFAAGQMTRMQLAAKTAGAVMSRTGSTIMGAFGGPVGLAVTGVSLALMGLASEAMDAAADTDTLKNAIASADEIIAKYNPAADAAAAAANSIGNEATTAVPKINAFAGAVGAAAQQLWELAKAKQAAALAELRTERENTSRALAANIQRTPEGVRAEMGQAPRSLSGAFGTLSRGFVGGVKDIWTGGESTRQLYQNVADGREALARLDSAIADANRDLEQFAVPDTPAPSVTAPGGKPKSRGSGRSGAAEARRLANEEERDRREALQRQRALEDDLFRVGDAMLSALMERQLTAQEQLDLDLQALQRDRDANKRAIDREVQDKDKTEAEGEMLKELEDAVYRERVANRTRDGQQAIRDEALAAEQALLDLNLELLQIQAGSARTAAESRRIQLEILRLQQQRARAELEQRISTDPTINAAEARRRLGLVEQAQTAAVVQQTQDPLEAWFDSTLQSAEEVREAYQLVAADGLEAISNGIVDIVTGAKTAKEAFRDMAMSIIQDIAKIGAKQFVSAIFGGGQGGGGGGGAAGNIFSSIWRGITGRANGGIINGTGSGTSDSNLIRVSDGEFVTREKQTRKYRALLEAINADKVPGFARGGVVGSAGAAGALPTSFGQKLVHNFFIDAKGAILADQLMQEMEGVSATHAASAGYTAVSFQQSRAQRGAVRNRQRFV